jgi:hypothetical protein
LRESSDAIPRKLTADYEFPMAAYDTADVLRCPHILEWAINSGNIRLVSEYFGCLPTLTSLNVWWSFPGAVEAATQEYHRDLDDFAQVVIFCYLTKVGNENGPHIYQVASHRGESTGQEVRFFGEPGTTIAIDGFGLHRGAPVTSGMRLMVWARYCLHRNWLSRPPRVRWKEMAGRVHDTELYRWVTRMIIAD